MMLAVRFRARGIIGEFPVKVWITLPVLFVGATIGLTAVVHILINPEPLRVSGSVLFGGAAALCLATGFSATWRSVQQRRWLLFGCTTWWLLLAMMVGPFPIPKVLALVIGASTTALLVLFALRARSPAG